VGSGEFCCVLVDSDVDLTGLTGSDESDGSGGFWLVLVGSYWLWCVLVTASSFFLVGPGVFWCILVDSG
jgi:hypothetical protein